MLAAALFDLDGLLVDSEPLWQEAEISVFGSLGFPMTNAMCGQTTGLRIDEAVEYWHARFGWQGKSNADVVAAILDTLEVLIDEKARPMAGVEEAIQFFTRKNLRIGLASSSPTRILQRTLRHLGLTDAFAVVQSAESLPYGKPHPAVYLEAAAAIGAKPVHCVAIEDSFNGLLAAKSARMKTVAVPEPAHFTQTKYDIADVKLPSLLMLAEEHWHLLNDKS